MSPPVDPDIQFIYDTVKQLCEHLGLDWKYVPEIRENEVHLEGIWVRVGDPSIPEECYPFDMFDNTIMFPGYVIESGAWSGGSRWDPPDYDVFFIATMRSKWDAAKWLIMHAIGMEIENILNSGEPDYDEPDSA